MNEPNQRTQDGGALRRKQVLAMSGAVPTAPTGGQR